LATFWGLTFWPGGHTHIIYAAFNFGFGQMPPTSKNPKGWQGLGIFGGSEEATVLRSKSMLVSFLGVGGT